MARKPKAPTKPIKINQEPKYTKKQFLASKTLGYNRDVLAAVLVDGGEYTKPQAKKLVEDFLKRKVK